MSDFLSMGGHGLYVWLSYGLSLVVMVALAWHVRRERKRFALLAHARSRRLGSTSSSEPVKEVVE